MKRASTHSELLLENDELRARLEEAEETLRAIRNHEVDALMVEGPEGEQVFTLKGAEQPYRIIVEAMGEGAVTIAPDQTVLYCNRRFAEIIRRPLNLIMGAVFPTFIAAGDQPLLKQLLAARDGDRKEMMLETGDGTEIPAYISARMVCLDDRQVVSMVVTDLTSQKEAHAQLSESNRLLRQEIVARKIIEEELKESRERLRYLSINSRKVREEERTSLSRELHDELGQVLTGIKMDVAWIGRRTPEDNATIIERVDSLLTLIDDAIVSVQKISMALRPPALDDFGLQEAMRLAAEDFEKRTKVACEIISKPQNIFLKEEISTQAFRIFQEALTNVARHAGAAQKVTVSLRTAGDTFIMEVRDDGRGITKKEISDLKSIGLTGMRERAFAMGGSLTVAGTRGKGTTITLSVPLSGGKEEPDILKRRRRKQPEEG
jgi:PAS domain S-box-containing protein